MKRAGAELPFGCDVGSVGAALLLLLCGACLHVAVWRGVPWREAVSRNAHGGLEGWPPGILMLALLATAKLRGM